MDYATSQHQRMPSGVATLSHIRPNLYTDAALANQKPKPSDIGQQKWPHMLLNCNSMRLQEGEKL